MRALLEWRLPQRLVAKGWRDATKAAARAKATNTAMTHRLLAQAYGSRDTRMGYPVLLACACCIMLY